MRKKSLILSLAFLGAAFAIPAFAYSPSQGDLIKVYGNSAVYYVDDSGYRHLFPTEKTFFSWYSGSWGDQQIITVSNYEFNQIPTGKNITLKPGYALMKFDNSQVTYAVLPGGQLCYASAYGNYQYNRAVVIPAGFQADYYANGNCSISSGSQLPDGTLFRYANSSDIYYVQNGLKRRVTSYGMSANNLRSESIVTNVDWSISYSDGADLNSYDSTVSNISYYLSNYNYYGNSYNNGYYNNGYYSYNYCSENWNCNSWSTCSSGYQYRSCYDLNNCGTANSKPATGQSCYSYSYNYLCSENWTCGSWGSCSSNKQYRSCWDLNSCGTTASKPATSQTCSSCSESWTCGSWSSCAYNKQYRTCWDSNSCGTTAYKPIVSQTCSSCTESWTCGSWGACQTTGLSNGWQFRTCTDSNSCGTTKSKPTTSQVCSCSTNWSCTSWTTCSSNRQTRSCIDLNNCGTASGQPITSQTCY